MFSCSTRRAADNAVLIVSSISVLCCTVRCPVEAVNIDGHTHPFYHAAKPQLVNISYIPIYIWILGDSFSHPCNTAAHPRTVPTASTTTACYITAIARHAVGEVADRRGMTLPEYNTMPITTQRLLLDCQSCWKTEYRIGQQRSHNTCAVIPMWVGSYGTTAFHRIISRGCLPFQLVCPVGQQLPSHFFSAHPARHA